MRRQAAPALRTALSLMPLLLTACIAPPERSPWFDRIEHLPLKFTEVGGHRIAYLDQGEGPAVILIHGHGGAMWHWEHQQAALGARHRVVTLDLLGSGLSDKPDLDYTPTELLESFRGFMDAVGIQRAALVGNSMGAGLAMAMALTYPERVDRLVLIAGFPDHVREKLASPLFRRAVDSRVPIWLVRLGSWLAGRSTTRRILSEVVHDQSLLTPLVIERSYRNRQDTGFLAPTLKMVRNLPLWEESFAKRIAEVRHPTLIIWGEQDRLFPPQVGRELQATIRGSRLELVPEAGHMPQWERPEVVNRLLLVFLQP
ncbi:alpha/beta fold hydrolase [Nitrospira sp. Kam-Ns4a]